VIGNELVIIETVTTVELLLSSFKSVRKQLRKDCLPKIDKCY
jgi:hypothetical protein